MAGRRTRPKRTGPAVVRLSESKNQVCCGRKNPLDDAEYVGAQGVATARLTSSVPGIVHLTFRPSDGPNHFGHVRDGLSEPIASREAASCHPHDWFRAAYYTSDRVRNASEQWRVPGCLRHTTNRLAGDPCRTNAGGWFPVEAGQGARTHSDGMPQKTLAFPSGIIRGGSASEYCSTHAAWPRRDMRLGR